MVLPNSPLCHGWSRTGTALKRMASASNNTPADSPDNAAKEGLSLYNSSIYSVYLGWLGTSNSRVPRRRQAPSFAEQSTILPPTPRHHAGEGNVGKDEGGVMIFIYTRLRGVVRTRLPQLTYHLCRRSPVAQAHPVASFVTCMGGGWEWMTSWTWRSRLLGVEGSALGPRSPSRLIYYKLGLRTESESTT